MSTHIANSHRYYKLCVIEWDGDGTYLHTMAMTTHRGKTYVSTVSHNTFVSQLRDISRMFNCGGITSIDFPVATQRTILQPGTAMGQFITSKIQFSKENRRFIFDHHLTAELRDCFCLRKRVASAHNRLHQRIVNEDHSTRNSLAFQNQEKAPGTLILTPRP